MEIALIPPSSLMHYADSFKYQMMLPSPRNINYLQYYALAGMDPRRYLILDNGAWEKEPLSNTDLIAAGWRYHVQEIVAPDVLNEPIATVRAMQTFFRDWENATVIQGQPVSWHPSFMAVAHGDTIAKAAKFVDHVAQYMPLVETIAAGRAFSRACNDPYARAKLAMLIDDDYSERFAFHLLGYNDAWAGEIGACRGIVRSLDTCAPFTAAHYGKGMRDILEHNTPRPANYFDLTEGDFDINLLEQNIKRLRDYADHPEPRQIPLRDVSPTWPPITT